MKYEIYYSYYDDIVDSKGTYDRVERNDIIYMNGENTEEVLYKFHKVCNGKIDSIQKVKND